MNSSSPFSTIRFEHEGLGGQTYYLPPDIFPRLEKKCPAYLIGTRGTGKTTLLMALNWKNRLRDPNLQSQIPDGPFAARYIGVYLKLPEYHIQRIDGWAGPDEDRCNHFVSLYLEMLWSELIIDSVFSLQSEDVLRINAKDEVQFVQSVKDEFASSRLIKDSLAGRRSGTLVNLKYSIRGAREEMERLALSKSDPTKAIALFPTRPPGGFVALIAKRLADLCDSGESSDSDKGWHFKVCMDEGESLTCTQQLLLSTIIRTCSFPFLPIASFVDMPASEDKTLFPSLTLQRADRELINLNDDGMDFRSFAEGVATSRVYSRLGADYAFSCDTIFGKLDLDALLLQLLNGSENPRAKELLKSARDRQNESGEIPADPDVDEGEGNVALSHAPPILKTYIDQKLGLKDVGGEERWLRRRHESQTYRKYMVSAYLSIFHEFNTDPKYAYNRMIIGMSDRCIRDFLLQVDEVYVRSDFDLPTFLSRTTPISVQSKALKHASEQKFLDLKSWVLHSYDRVNSLVRGLALYTAIVQSSGPESRQLKIPERGRFVLSRSEDIQLEDPQTSHAGVQLSDVVRDAAQAGYLRILSSNEHAIIFRVHASLAAHFGFSYRGAFYPINVSGRDLVDLMSVVGDKDIQGRVNAMVKKGWGEGEPEYYPLFDDQNSPPLVEDESP